MFIQIVVISFVAAFCYVSCQDHVMGGQEPYCTSLNDPLVKEAVKAINEYYASLGSNPRMAVKVLNATRLIVAGTIYRFKIQIKGGQTFENCEVKIFRPLMPDSTEAGEVLECKEAKHLLS